MNDSRTMSLERNQRMHDSFISNSHNISGSNDPQQIPHDVNEVAAKDSTTDTLIAGAQAILAGRQNGLSDDETMQVLLRNAQ